MAHYILRLDDASHYMDLQKWSQMEQLLDRYDIKPIFGIIPKTDDELLISKYSYNPSFWDLVHRWIDKGWIPAMHGYEHKYVTKDGGINPVNMRSEFAGLPYQEQAEKIRKAYQILESYGIKPEIFFAPSHTFDENTLKAIKEETPIRIICDTVAWDTYKDHGFGFIPQQSGSVRKLPFHTVTFCYHPNNLNEKMYTELEVFLEKNNNHFQGLFEIKNREKTLIDIVLQEAYFRWHDLLRCL